MLEQLTSALTQVLGLQIKGFQWNKKFTLLFVGILGLAISSTIFQFFFINGFFEITKSDNSPYWQILKSGFSFDSVVLALIYCGLKASLSEEILFRGLVT
jgi:membrane protease YdiL (CAAX protease family)